MKKGYALPSLAAVLVTAATAAAGDVSRKRGAILTGGMPFVLTRQVDYGDGFGGATYALDPGAFRVEVGARGRVVTPVCATLNPAVDETELNTILLAGDFGVGDADMPTKIQVVGEVRTVDGESLRGLEIDSIYPPDTGSNLLRAAVYDPADGTIDTSGPASNAYCPEQQTSKATTSSTPVSATKSTASR